MTDRQEIVEAAEEFATSANLFYESLRSIFPKLSFTLTAIKVIHEKRPLAELAETLKMFHFIDLEELEREGDELRELGNNFVKASEKMAEVMSRPQPYFPGNN